MSDKKETANTVSRRGLLRGATLAAGSAALFAASLAPQQAVAGMTQQAAGYQTTPKDGKKCDGCALFRAPSSCTIVAGTISPDGWCRFYAKKPA